MDERFLIDFGIFMQAVADLMAGLNPYAREGFFSPPWLFYLTYPFSLLPTNVGRAVWFFMSLGSLLFCLRAVSPKHRYRSLWIIGLAISPATWPNALFGNIVALVGVGLIGLFRWRRSWLAIPLVLLKPQLSLVAIIIWVTRSKRDDIVKACGLLATLNLPVVLWKPALYWAFLQKSISGEYLQTQSLHITAATGWLPFGSSIWLISSIALMSVLVLLSLLARDEQITLLSTILADPVAGGGEYALLAVAAAMENLRLNSAAIAIATAFALPLLSLFVPNGHSLALVATAILLGWAIYSKKKGI